LLLFLSTYIIPTYMTISIICPVYNEEKYIEQCINSILSFDYHRDEMEVLFVDGKSTDSTRSIILSYIERFPFIKLLDNPYKIVPYAMNIGIENAHGEVIIRLDAHAFYPSDYASKLVYQLDLLHADNVGAVCLTDVKEKTKVSTAIKEVLSQRFGVGNSLFRTGTDKIMEVDTVPFGCFRKDVFTRFGLYDTRLVRNQDIELNKRIKRGGGKIFLISGVFCTYFARDNFKDFIKSNYGNGLWNILTVYFTKTSDSLSLRHYIPLFFMLSLLLPTIGALVWFPLIYITLFSCVSYMVLITVESINAVRKSRVSYFHMVGAFIALHFPYGMGSLVGLIELFFKFIRRK